MFDVTFCSVISIESTLLLFFSFCTTKEIFLLESRIPTCPLNTFIEFKVDEAVLVFFDVVGVLFLCCLQFLNWLTFLRSGSLRWMQSSSVDGILVGILCERWNLQFPFDIFFFGHSGWPYWVWSQLFCKFSEEDLRVWHFCRRMLRSSFILSYSSKRTFSGTFFPKFHWLIRIVHYILECSRKHLIFAVLWR